ncbi:alpha/beta hydrolase family protein [Draconibacterium sediminis]|uniref:alpha/beta hydrolase family protein n=1 Tax=Draconibacterium sediminis TaxID=1544798 RepID=UPI0005D325C7|nr:alpha/beta hydrolase [Draconibacterium sediminis]
MKVSCILILLLILFCGLNQADAQNLNGYWVGKVNLPTLKITTSFHVSEDESGKPIITLSVLEDGTKDLPCELIKVTTDSMVIYTPKNDHTYSGVFQNDTTIKGEWSKNGINTPLNLVKTDEVPILKRPQIPQPPFPYLIEDVEYVNTESGYKLAGTLTCPDTTSPCPAVVMITGSSAQDRDETIYGHKLFWVIADYFARNGIAVLRVDDRGVGGSEGNISTATSKDFAGDVLAGVELLTTRKEIDPQNIGLIGHSEGGLIAPIAATKSKDIAFIVMMAGPGTVGEQILKEQNALALEAAGLPEFQIKQSAMINQRIFEIIKTEPDSAKTLEQLRTILSQGFYPGMNDEMKAAIDAKIAGVNNNWFRYFLTYDPKPTLEKVTCPVLAINGAKDVQVPVSNLDSIKSAITSGGNTKVTTIAFENLNHLFQNCDTGSAAEYSQIEETIDSEVLKTMKNWIVKQTKN